MKQLLKLLSNALLLLLFVNILPEAFAAAEQSRYLAMTSNKTVIRDGETFPVTVAAEQAFETRGVGITVCYDSALQPDWDLSSGGEGLPFTVSGPVTLGDKTALRISFYPTDTPVAVTAGQILAELTFTAAAPSEAATVEMTAVYLYDENLELLDILPAEPVSVKIDAIDVTGIRLNQESATLEIGKKLRLQAAVMPSNASDKTVQWTTADEAIATVDENGLVTAVNLGETIITATASGGYSARCKVTVETPPDAGYVVSLPVSKEIVVGEIITVSPVIRNEEQNVYNAYDFRFSYDPQKLELITDNLEEAGITVHMEAGRFSVLNYGPDISVGEEAPPPFILQFRALATGDTRLALEEARVDHSENALLKNAALATPLREVETTAIRIKAFPVTMSQDFESSLYTVEPGGEFTFKPASPYYEFNFAQSTVADQPLTGVEQDGDNVILHFGGVSTEDISQLYVAPKENGKFIIPNVTGSVVIQAEKQGKTYPVTIIGSDITGNAQAHYEQQYSLTFDRDSAYTYTLAITIGGVPYTYGSMDRWITIPGNRITGPIQVTVTKTAIVNPDVTPTMYHTVTLPDMEEIIGSDAQVVSGGSFTFRLEKQEGYSYQLRYTMGDGAPQSLWPNEDGSYTIANITADVVVTLERTQDKGPGYEVEVVSYIELDSKTMYLVLVRGTLDDSNVFTYDNQPMYYSDAYQSWCTLTVESQSLTADLAMEKIDTQPNQVNVIRTGNCDINMTGQVDVNDAQLVYDMYKARYTDFEKISVKSFLLADVNADRKVALNDAVAVLRAIE